MILLVFIYVYRIDMNIERLVKDKQQSTFKSKQKYDKLLLQVQCPVQSDLQPSVSYFLFMLFTESLHIYLC